MNSKLFIRSSFAVVICLIFGFMGTVATQTGLAEWYQHLEKPWFHLDVDLFSWVWIFMYVLMGVAAGIVWSKGFYHKWVKTALIHFGFQLSLNGFWFLIFFALEQPLIALLDLIILFIVILFTIKWFRIVSSTAAYMLIPYAVWVLFAIVFNFEIWRLNS
ncbi:TspO/MBR family protein [Christiangramia sabulilitoris]|uniref:Tryptophan-rich sensory protein n=1 Tax=Christiangramia sabulilitoris TaxID=2583991 RepID=A0A550I088_9FLAO|nr:TspO/MBR family protein [Christiangramia sabulilitoris]TRO64392.1 tryptophan-rich sensory protein [Christiangramia sabulilitoris]